MPTAKPATGQTTSAFTANWYSSSGATGYRLDMLRKSILFVAQSDDDAKEFAQVKLNPFLKRIPQLVATLKNEKYAQTNMQWLWPTHELIISGPGERVMDAASAYVTVDMMRNVFYNGTAKKAQREGMDFAGKTGTTSNFVDAWFAGYSPRYTVVVWVKNSRAALPCSLGPRPLRLAPPNGTCGSAPADSECQPLLSGPCRLFQNCGISQPKLRKAGDAARVS